MRTHSTMRLAIAVATVALAAAGTASAHRRDDPSARHVLLLSVDGLRERIAEDGDLRRFVNVYVEGEDIRFLDGLETPVEDGDEVTILPAVAGGR